MLRLPPVNKLEYLQKTFRWSPPKIHSKLSEKNDYPNLTPMKLAKMTARASRQKFLVGTTKRITPRTRRAKPLLMRQINR